MISAVQGELGKIIFQNDSNGIRTHLCNFTVLRNFSANIIHTANCASFALHMTMTMM
jgi:hypothetical protein